MLVKAKNIYFATMFYISIYLTHIFVKAENIYILW